MLTTSTKMHPEKSKYHAESKEDVFWVPFLLVAVCRVESELPFQHLDNTPIPLNLLHQDSLKQTV